MKPINTLYALATLAAASLFLAACGKTTNSSSPTTTAAVPASQCVMGSDGVLRDQYGRNCSSYGTNACVGAYFNPSTGQYVNSSGQAVNCTGTGYVDGYNSIPYQGYYGGQMIQGCQGWSVYYSQQYGYSIQYVPVDIGNGQLVCMNTAYLQQQNPNLGQNYWNQWYYSQQPVYTCTPGYDCGGGYYYGQQYSCGSQLSLGFNFGGIGVGYNTCNPF